MTPNKTDGQTLIAEDPKVVPLDTPEGQGILSQALSHAKQCQQCKAELIRNPTEKLRAIGREGNLNLQISCKLTVLENTGQQRYLVLPYVGLPAAGMVGGQSSADGQTPSEKGPALVSLDGPQGQAILTEALNRARQDPEFKAALQATPEEKLRAIGQERSLRLQISYVIKFYEETEDQRYLVMSASSDLGGKANPPRFY